VIYVLNTYTLFILMIIFLLPLVLDGFTQLLGVRVSNNNLRFVTGALTGGFLGCLINWLIFHIFFL
jgi:uncharacterized membrane protein